MSQLTKAITGRFNDAKTAINNKYQIAPFMQSKGYKIESNRQICCPFHDDSTPSFSVNTERNIWKCFGCPDGGHFLDLWIKYENKFENHEYSVYTAVETLLAADQELQSELGFKTIFRSEESDYDLFANVDSKTENFNFDALLMQKMDIKPVKTDSLKHVMQTLKKEGIESILAFITDCELGMSEPQLISKYYRKQDEISDFIMGLTNKPTDIELIDAFKEALE